MISFGSPFTDSDVRYPILTNDVLIAPFWANSDVSQGGDIFFRLSADESILNTVGFTISEANFNPQLVLIATWDQVPLINDQPSNVCLNNYFTTAILKGPVDEHVLLPA